MRLYGWSMRYDPTMVQTDVRHTEGDGPVAEQQAGPYPKTALAIGGVLLLAFIITVAYRNFGDSARGVDHVVDGPAIGGRQTATVDLISGAASVTVRGGDLGDRLYRVSTPDGARLAPSAGLSGDTVQVRLADRGGTGASTVVVVLSNDVTWQVRLTAGANSEVVDLRGTRTSGVEFVGGASSIDLTLPRPSGTVPVRMEGGASRFAIHAPNDVPVRVRAGGGAGNITVDGTVHNGIAAGTVSASDGWDGAQDRYDVDNTAGVSTVFVDRVV
jgi:hypothetical protein